MSAISANLTAPPDNFSTTLSSGISDTSLSIPLNSVSGLPTEGVGVLFTKDSNGDVVAGSVEIIHWTGIGGSALTLTNTGDRGLTGSDSGAQAYSAGAYFEVWVTSYYYKSLYDGIAAINVGSLIHAAANKSTPVDADEFGIYDSVAALFKNVTWANIKTTLLTWLRLSTTIIPVNAPQGFLINGKIVVTDSAGITVAIKTLAGTDPSATDPVYCRIGDTVRTITAALSVVRADGTNWFNSGSSELATKEVDYFVYLAYRASDSSVVMFFSRQPGETDGASVGTVSTGQFYGALSGGANLAAGDYCELIGRFAATLSAGAGYTWSVPAFTALNLIQRPIYESRWLDYARVVTSGSGSPTTVTNNDSVYKVIGKHVFVNTDNTVTAKGTASSTFIVSLPFTSAGSGKTAFAGREEAATGKAFVGSVSGATATALDYINGTLWVDTYRIPITVNYEI